VERKDLSRGDHPAEQSLGVSRARVLELLQHSARPVGSGEVASKTGLHPNTARFHLDGLVSAGLAERTMERREVPGRPRALYTSRPDHLATGPRSYRLLAEILTSYLASQSRRPGAEAQSAGEAWGHALAQQAPHPASTGDAQATRILTDTLEEIGFAPQATGRGSSRQILLRHCPFREAAVEHREVVCGVHLGLMRGLLTELGSSLQAERLDPFVEPTLCVASLTKRDRT
jgi:predicted ArsR family transcriptional regulator